MISDIKTGNFTAEELGKISKFAKDENGRVFICNLSNMYTASCPSDMEMTSVTWYGGDAYCFYLSADGDGPTGSVDFKSQKRYEEDINFYCNLEEETPLEVTAVGSEPERNATSYEMIDKLDRAIKFVIYKTGEGDAALNIVEHYCLEENSSIPSYIIILGQENGKCFEVIVKNLQERPSVEWLSQFGIREYVETEVA